MIKKAYRKPTISVVKLQHQTHILAGSGPKTLQGPNTSGNGSAESDNGSAESDYYDLE